MLKATDQEIEDVREYPERNEADEGADSSSPRRGWSRTKLVLGTEILTSTCSDGPARRGCGCPERRG